MSLWYSKLSFYEPNCLSLQPKYLIPRYHELKAVNITESKLKISNIKIQILYEVIFERCKLKHPENFLNFFSIFDLLNSRYNELVFISLEVRYIESLLYMLRGVPLFRVAFSSKCTESLVSVFETCAESCVELR